MGHVSSPKTPGTPGTYPLDPLDHWEAFLLGGEHVGFQWVGHPSGPPPYVNTGQPISPSHYGGNAAGFPGHGSGAPSAEIMQRYTAGGAGFPGSQPPTPGGAGAGQGQGPGGHFAPPQELVNLGLASRHGRLDERWTSFMHENGFL